MVHELVPDALWERVAYCCRLPRRSLGVVAPRASDRAALETIVFVLRTGIPWEMLPTKLFGLSGMTAWRRLELWTRAGVFGQLQRDLLSELGQQGQVDFSRALNDSSSVRASRGAFTAKNPTDRAKAGSKHHLLVDRKGLPLAESMAGANAYESHELFPLLDAVPDVKQPRGRPRHRPGNLHADKAYSSRKNRRGLRRRGITPRIARPGIESKQRLGLHRWEVERTNSWLNRQRRLRVRDERRDGVHFGLLVLGCCLILFRGLNPDFC